MAQYISQRELRKLERERRRDDIEMEDRSAERRNIAEEDRQRRDRDIEELRNEVLRVRQERKEKRRQYEDEDMHQDEVNRILERDYDSGKNQSSERRVCTEGEHIRRSATGIGTTERIVKRLSRKESITEELMRSMHEADLLLSQLQTSQTHMGITFANGIEHNAIETNTYPGSIAVVRENETAQLENEMKAKEICEVETEDLKQGSFKQDIHHESYWRAYESTRIESNDDNSDEERICGFKNRRIHYKPLNDAEKEGTLRKATLGEKESTQEKRIVRESVVGHTKYDQDNSIDETMTWIDQKFERMRQENQTREHIKGDEVYETDEEIENLTNRVEKMKLRRMILEDELDMRKAQEQRRKEDEIRAEYTRKQLQKRERMFKLKQEENTLREKLRMCEDALNDIGIDGKPTKGIQHVHKKSEEIRHEPILAKQTYQERRQEPKQTKPPKLPRLTEDTFEEWKIEVEVMLNSDIYTKESLLHTVRNSICNASGNIRRVLPTIPTSATTKDILEKLENIYGDRRSGESHLAEFYKAKQLSDENVAEWGLRLENILRKAENKGQINGQQKEQMLKKRFWKYLFNEKLKLSTRILFEKCTTFEELRKEVRIEEKEVNSDSDSTDGRDRQTVRRLLERIEKLEDESRRGDDRWKEEPKQGEETSGCSYQAGSQSYGNYGQNDRQFDRFERSGDRFRGRFQRGRNRYRWQDNRRFYRDEQSERRGDYNADKYDTYSYRNDRHFERNRGERRDWKHPGEYTSERKGDTNKRIGSEIDESRRDRYERTDDRKDNLQRECRNDDRKREGNWGDYKGGVDRQGGKGERYSQSSWNRQQKSSGGRKEQSNQ